MVNKFVVLAIVWLFFQVTAAKTVKYELKVSQVAVNLSGKKLVDFALSVNGSIPAPTLEFTEGDDAEITVVNNLSSGEEVSMHWHGILLPPEEDGVAYVNTPPILMGQSRTFRFKLRQHGTFWYHSHTMLQEQKGVFGAFIIQPKKKTIEYDKEVVAVLSDWSDENPDNILKNLKKDGDYYLHKKNSIRSIFGAAAAGGLGTFFKNEWIRMGGMDLSDVGYDAFLINGKTNFQLVDLRPGEKARLRIINAGASSYFYVSLGGLPMTVVSADGVDIVPVEAKEILMGMAETYDVIFSIPENKSYELRATVQDVTGFASAWMGAGEKVFATNKASVDLYAGMDHSTMDHSTMNHATMDHSKMDHSSSSSVETLTVEKLKSPIATAFEDDKKIHDVKLVLGGDMERYIWYINGKSILEDRLIEIQEGEIVRFTFVNETMMHHPMHLHGHFFRVLNANGEFSPLKHTVDVGPHMTRTIEFFANEPGQWMLHCHNLFHMKTGMARVVKYSSWSSSPEMKEHEKHDSHMHDHWYHYSKIALATQGADFFYRASQTWYQLEFTAAAEAKNPKDFSLGQDLEYQGEIFYRRCISQFASVVGGGTFSEDEATAKIGFSYMLPLLIESQVLMSHKGHISFEFEKKLQWTSFTYSDIAYSWSANLENEKGEFDATLMYSPNWHWAAGLNYASEKFGATFELQF